MWILFLVAAWVSLKPFCQNKPAVNLNCTGLNYSKRANFLLQLACLLCGRRIRRKNPYLLRFDGLCKPTRGYRRSVLREFPFQSANTALLWWFQCHHSGRWITSWLQAQSYRSFPPVWKVTEVLQCDVESYLFGSRRAGREIAFTH